MSIKFYEQEFLLCFCVISAMRICDKRIKIIIIYLGGSNNIYSSYISKLVILLKGLKIFSS